MAAGTPIEFGPGIHGIDEITYLYVREPGGFRIEINSGGWQNYQPDWEAPVDAAAGRDDALEEPADAGIDDGVLAARRGRRRPKLPTAGFHSTELFDEQMSGVRHLSSSGAASAACRPRSPCAGPASTSTWSRRTPPGTSTAWESSSPATRCGRCTSSAWPSGLSREGHPMWATDVPGRRRDRHRRQRLAAARARAAAGERDHAPPPAPDPPGRRARLGRRRADRRDHRRRSRTPDDARRRRLHRRRRAQATTCVVGADGLYSRPASIGLRAGVQPRVHRTGLLALQPAAHRGARQDLGCTSAPSGTAGFVPLADRT